MGKVIVIGGGAAGLVSAIVASREGAKVTLLEKMDRVGKKILATGNGRCNISNSKAALPFYHGGQSQFIEEVLKGFDVKKTIAFFEELGLLIKEESGGKLYPYSDQAASVVDVLRYEIERLGIKVQCETVVKKIEQRKKDFVVYDAEGTKYYGHKVIVATGGRATSKLGSNGEGYGLLKEFGHQSTALYPALVQLELKADFLKGVKGVKFMGDVSIEIDGDERRKEYGEILYTDYGISGPPILQLSQIASMYVDKKEKVTLTVDMMTDYSAEELDDLLMKRFGHIPFKSMEEGLIGLINKRLILPYLKLSQIDKTKHCGQLTKDERQRLVKVLKSLNLEVTGTKSWANAQVTAGGIKVQDLEPSSLESKKVKGLYIVGELQDIHGDCGGFNLQWAWSTGYLSGVHAARN